jgi:hypothetical protein
VSAAAGAQQIKPTPQRNGGYDQSRETALQGTVVSFSAKSQAPSMGAHVVVQTSSGTVDVHLGNANVLKAGGLDLKPGDSVRIIGENVEVGDGTFFAARILQKGTQAVLLRSPHGIPLAPPRVTNSSAAAQQQGGAR